MIRLFAHVWYVRLPTRRLPLFVVTVIRTTTLPFGRPRRSIGRPSALPFTVRAGTPVSLMTALTKPLTPLRWILKCRRLTQTCGDGSVAICVIGTGVGAGGLVTGGVMTGGGVVVTAATFVTASGSAGAASRPQLASSALVAKP